MTSFETLAAVKANLSSYVDRAQEQHERTVITRRGKPAAVLVSVDDLESLEETLVLLSDPFAQAEIARAREEYARGEYTTREEMDELIRARIRAERG